MKRKEGEEASGRGQGKKGRMGQKEAEKNVERAPAWISTQISKVSFLDVSIHFLRYAGTVSRFDYPLSQTLLFPYRLDTFSSLNILRASNDPEKKSKLHLTDDHWSLTTDIWPLTSDHQWPTIEHRPPATNHWPSTTDHQQLTSDHHPQIADD